MKPFASPRPVSVRRMSFSCTLHSLLLALLSLSPLLLCSPAAVHAQWGPDIRLTYNSLGSYTRYTNAWYVASSGNIVHAVWWDDRLTQGITEIFYKRSTDGGVTWSPDILLSNDDDIISQYPSIAVSGPSGQFVHVVWCDRADWDIHYRRSTNYGEAFGDESNLSNIYGQSLRPSLTVFGSNLHLVWEEWPGMYSTIYTIRSTDDGATWIDENELYNPNIITTRCPSVAVSGPSGQFVHVVWDGYIPSGYFIYYQRSTDWGEHWNEPAFPLGQLTTNEDLSPSIAASDRFVHVFWHSTPINYSKIKNKRSTDYGAQGSWGNEEERSHGNSNSQFPSAVASGSEVHLVWSDSREWVNEIYYQHSPDNGDNWDPQDTRLSHTNQAFYPSVATSDSKIHVVWECQGAGWEIYYKGNPPGNGFFGFKTDSSNGRHLVRDPSRGHLHMVMTGQDGYVYYARSSDDGFTWPHLQKLWLGKNPTIGLAMLPEDCYPPKLAVCVVFTPPDPTSYLYYRWNDGYDDPGMGTWYDNLGIPAPANTVGQPSLVAIGTQVYLAYQAGTWPDYVLYCQNFPYNNTYLYVRETIDDANTPSQPSLGVDGNGFLYAAWRRATNNGEIWFAPRGGILLPPWYPTTHERIDDPSGSYPSQQPFLECYGDHAYVAYSDDQPLFPSDVWRADRQLIPPPQWVRQNVCIGLPTANSESPSQAGSEFTTWAEGTGGGMFDNYYWRASNTERNPVLSNPTTWSYWPHSQMWNGWFWDTHLVSAWTESPNANNPPYTVLTHHLYWGFGGGGGGGFLSEPSGDKGAYYTVVTGLDSLSPYCKKRDGVMRFEDKSVDYARDSLIYELPYLDPMHDYLVKVSSYRETGANWAQALSVNGKTVRSVQFAPNKVDTAWFKIPPSAYARDRKVAFSLRNVKGDYVTSLGLTLYQRDPRRGKGGPQIGETAVLPVREVFAVSPNPMNNQALIEYSLTSPGKVDLSVYDVTGGLVRRVVDAAQPAGAHKVTWDGCDQAGRRVSSGIYFVRLTSPAKVKTARVVVVR